MLTILPVVVLLAAPDRDPTKRPQPPVFKFLGDAKDGALNFEVTDGRGSGWCGNGARWVQVAARTTVRFKVEPPRGEWDEVRVWLLWCVTEEGKRVRVTAWSEPVRRKKP